MKKLSQFTIFDIEAFLKEKRLMVIAQQEWKDYNTKDLCGTKTELVIIQDNTDYGEKGVTNLYEKIIVKVPKVITLPMNAEVRLKNPEATVYGDYRNQLSIIAQDIEVISK